MSESVQVSDEFHEFLESRRREDETMEETLRRLVGRPRPRRKDGSEPERTGVGEPEQTALTGPHPEEVAGIISSETAKKMRERIDRLDEADVADKRELREQFE